jgi:wobble nucleotide-excising tRNase
MKIKTIEKIKSLGLYQNFAWDDQCNEFNKYNFFYGWNYSGKTTLSRLFKCLEDKKFHSDYPQMEFTIKTDNDTLTQKDIGSNYSIRVFNEDFVEENFEWNNENKEIELILILGKESKELEKKLKESEINKKKKEDSKKTKEKEKSIKESEHQRSLTNKASEIRSILSITNPKEFDKNQLEKKIEEIKNDYQQLIQNESDFSKEKEILIEEARQEIQVSFPEYDLKEYAQKIHNTLQKRISVQKIFEKLKENQKLSEWVRQGIDLHKNEKYCQFCGNPLPKDRLEELQQHFSKEYDNLLQEIKGLEEEINNYFESIKSFTLPDSARFFKEFYSDYQNLQKAFDTAKSNFINLKPVLLTELYKKYEKPFDVLSFDIDNSLFQNLKEELNNIIVKIKSIIDKHNNKVNSLETRKSEAKEKIIKHLTAQFIMDENYLANKQEIENLNQEIGKLKQEIESLDSEINQINQQIKQSSIGAQKLNESLNTFFPDDRLKIERTENGKYKLFRNDKIAKNLSTGERNIISLIYFFTKLEETAFDKQNAIIFIDDPVSSLDSNHIHRINSLLVKISPEFGQVFVTTHNFDFFNLIKDSYRYDLKKKERNFYLIQKLQNDNSLFATIKNLPSILVDFKSEYNYLFSLVKTFQDSNSKNNFDQLFLIPNILRRFFEMYLFIRYPDRKEYKDKAHKYFNNHDSEEKSAALKIMDEYSHEWSVDHATKFPDIQELEKAVSFILNEINKNDKPHYDALCESIGNSDTNCGANI